MQSPEISICLRRKETPRDLFDPLGASCAINYSTVTDFARFLGLSTSQPFIMET